MSEKFKTFLNHYKTKEVYLNESPFRLGRHYMDDLDDSGFNVAEAQRIISETKPSDRQRPLSADLSKFRVKHTGDIFIDYWMTDQPFISCYFILEPSGGGVNSLGIWNHRTSKGSVRELFFSYYLKQYGFIVSDNKHTDQGEAFWKGVVERATKQGYPINILTRDKKEFDIDDVDAYWDNTNNFFDYRIKIYAKKY